VLRTLGFLAVYLGWAAGLTITVWGLRALVVEHDPSVEPTIAERSRAGWVLGALSLLVATLAFPWIGGEAADGSGELVLNGFEGLDVLSVASIVVLCGLGALFLLLPQRGGPDRALVLRTTGACLVAIVAGNALIQLTEPGGSRLEPGALASIAAAVLCAAVLELDARRI
jgi:hypothetical protein